MRKYLKKIRNPYKARPLPPKVLIGLVVVLATGLLIWLGYGLVTKDPVVNSFDTCIAAGNPVLESYPEQCVHEGQSYINPAQNVPHPF
jgi:hypothetical protein